MISVDLPETGPRGRTRRAILSAAASVLAGNRNATLAEIAEAADVGRSTLHRYFSDREELRRAVVEDSLAIMGEAVTEAAIDTGPAAAALRRLAGAMVGLGDRLLFLYGDPRELEGYLEHSAGPQDSEPMMVDPIETLIERGQAEGAFDPEVSVEWLKNVLYALVYTGCELVNNGTLPRHAATATVIRTMESGILARDTSATH